jgi:phosphoribosylglycinamide formyltransferase 1
MQRIAIFASGNGTNAQKIMEHFRSHQSIRVSMVLSNKSDAYVLKRAHKFQIPTLVFSRQDLYQSHHLLDILSVQCIDYIVLAGFLWLIPGYILEAYPNRILNIHPALLPDYGGKGMYGDRVHQAVLDSGDKESGITIHYVNEHYDQGDIVFQARCPVEPRDTVETLANRIHELEYAHYPEVIEKVVSGR